MKHIAILTGGPSAERGISEKSAQVVARYLDPSKYSYRYILMESDGWYEEQSGVAMDLNDFSLMVDDRREYFDLVFLMIHGTPAEDGKIQGYFEYLGIPHSTCDTLSSSLTFNKQMCKDYLQAHGIPLASSLSFAAREAIPHEAIAQLGLPVFVKPNNNGSSYGITKVKASADIDEAVRKALAYDTEVIVEAAIEGREFGCGVVRRGSALVAFPITEIIPEAEFFTYEAKYEGASQEITPANLPMDLTRICQDLSKRLYEVLRCRGMVRFDYILQEGIFYLLEANTIPGMSEASILPQQALAHGWTIGDLLDAVIEDCMKAGEGQRED